MTKTEATTLGPRARSSLTLREKQRLAVESDCAISTIYRWCKGDQVNSMLSARIGRGLDKMGIKVSG